MAGIQRRRKIYRERKNPVEYFDEHDFIARYRLSKHVVEELARQFEQSPFISTLGEGRGTVISPIERVSMVKLLVTT